MVNGEMAPQIAGIVTIAVLSAGIVRLSRRCSGTEAIRRTALPTFALVGGLVSAVLSGGWAMLASPEAIMTHVGAVYALAHAVNSRWALLTESSHEGGAGPRDPFIVVAPRIMRGPDLTRQLRNLNPSLADESSRDSSCSTHAV